MISKRTGVGISVGSVIIAIGAIALFTSIGLQTTEVDDTFGLGESESYRINAPQHATQTMKITGDSFDLTLESPEGGLQIPLTPHKKETSLDWVHLVDGESKIKIQNTGDSDLNVVATFQFTSEPILFTYHILVITAGVIIIGFSLGFSIRKPRGF